MFSSLGYGEFFFLVGTFTFIIFTNHYLFMLLSLEFIMFSLFFCFSIFCLSAYFSLDYIFLFLTMMILEGVFGLCLLISISRVYGNDFFYLLFL